MSQLVLQYCLLYSLQYDFSNTEIPQRAVPRSLRHAQALMVMAGGAEHWDQAPTLAVVLWQHRGARLLKGA